MLTTANVYIIQGAHRLEDLLENDGIEVELKSFETDEGIEGLGRTPFVRILHAIYVHFHVQSNQTAGLFFLPFMTCLK